MENIGTIKEVFLNIFNENHWGGTDRNYLYFPSKSLIEYWILKYFKSFECLGESIVEDNSYRLIYHCKK
jgi:hypothetical protein